MGISVESETAAGASAAPQLDVHAQSHAAHQTEHLTLTVRAHVDSTKLAGDDIQGRCGSS